MQVEELAKRVVNPATDEWGDDAVYSGAPSDKSPLQASVTELAQTLRYTHHRGDDCLGDAES